MLQIACEKRWSLVKEKERSRRSHRSHRSQEPKAKSHRARTEKKKKVMIIITIIIINEKKCLPLGIAVAKYCNSKKKLTYRLCYPPKCFVFIGNMMTNELRNPQPFRSDSPDPNLQLKKKTTNSFIFTQSFHIFPWFSGNVQIIQYHTI